MQKYVLDRNGNVVATFASDYNDKHTKTLQAGASTYEFTISKQDEAALFLETGNYVNFVDDVGKPWSFSILSYTETHNEKTVYCEDVGIELINKNVNAYKADAAYSFAFYFEMITKNTPWTIGINEIGDLSRKLEWTSNDTGLSRLLSLLTEFDNAECKFNVKFAQNKPTVFKVDIYKQIGNPSTNVQIVYSNELNDITKTESRAEFVTAIQGEGGTPTKNADGTDIVTRTNPDGTPIETPKITFADIQYKDDNYVSAKGDNFLRAVTANKLFNPNSQDTYIEGYYSYDTESPQELLNRTLTQLKKYSTPQYTYEADVKVIDKSLDLGDTVKIIDHDYKPGLYLEARVASLEKSYTDPSKNTITFTNYRLVNSSLAQKLADLQNIINSMPTASGISSIVTNVINNSNVIEQKILALQSADGRSTVYYDAKPSNAKEGDTAFVKNPDSGNMEIWNYVGDKWTLTSGDATFDDVKTQIDKAQADAQTAIDTANNAVSTANDNAAKFGTDIATLKADVTKSVADVGTKADTAIGSANEALTQIGTANSDLTKIKSDMDTVKGTLETVATSEQLDGVNKTATSAKALAETNANSIKNTVTKTELTTAKSEWSSAQSTITAGQISTEITKVNQTITDTTKNLVSQTVLNNAIVNSETGTKQVISKSIANISVGGRNLLTGTSSELKTKQLTNAWNVDVQATNGSFKIKVVKGQTYTYRAWLDNTAGSDNAFVNIRFLPTTEGAKDYPIVGSTSIIHKGETGYSTLVFTPQEDGYLKLTPSAYAAPVTALAGWKEEKLEKGNKSTDWSPAPEDQASVTAVNAIEQTVDGMKQTVANAATKTEVTKLAGQVTSVVSTANGNSSQITQLSKDINLRVTADQVDASILADKTIKDTRDDNQPPSWYYANYPKQTIEELKQTSMIGLTDGVYAQLTSEVAWTDKSVPIKQTARTNTQTYQRFSTSETAWSSWSTIANTSNMISQINISPESILIAGNKVHITGTTTIDAGIIKNAMIADATINGAKIQNASILSAKIANLDGGKITANSITADKLAVSAIEVGLGNYLRGALSIEPNAITISMPGGKSILDAKGLIMINNSSGKYSGISYQTLSRNASNSEQFGAMAFSGWLNFGDANIYGKGMTWAEDAHLHFEQRKVNGSDGLMLCNDLGTGIWIGNNQQVWVGKNFNDYHVIAS